MATEKQIPKLAGIITEHQSGFAALSTEDVDWAIKNGHDTVALFVSAVKNRARIIINKLLEFVTQVRVDAVKQFITADRFKAGQTIDGVKYHSSFGDNFNLHFLPKIEGDVQAVDLQVHKLLQNSKDLGIRTEIGEDKEETKLAHLHHLLTLQGNGEKGVLLTNGYANIFYIRGIDGNLWAVHARWYDGGWYLGADSVGCSDGWDAGRQVFSR
ncbi:MAG: hypothetical protein AAB470_00905 [Patescibacteria group bacterium]